MRGAAAAAAGVAGLAAAAGAVDFQPYSLIGTVLTPVIVVALLIMGKLRTEGEVKRVEASCARLEALLDRKDEQLQVLQRSVDERAIPALTRAALILESVAPLLQTETRVRRPPAGRST